MIKRHGVCVCPPSRVDLALSPAAAASGWNVMDVCGFNDGLSAVLPMYASFVYLLELCLPLGSVVMVSSSSSSSSHSSSSSSSCSSPFFESSTTTLRGAPPPPPLSWVLVYDEPEKGVMVVPAVGLMDVLLLLSLPPIPSAESPLTIGEILDRDRDRDRGESVDWECQNVLMGCEGKMN